MHYLKIEGCGECPFVGYRNSNEIDDSCRIVCDHPEQESKEIITAKIRSVEHNIYFSCPLPDIDDKYHE